MNGLLFTLNGVNGQLELYEDKVVIKRRGALAKMTQGFFKGDKSLYLTQISGIQTKKGTSFTNGYIQFTLSGGNENMRGILNATKDENSVMFAKKNNELVEEIKLKIEEIKQSNQSPTKQQLSGADEIIKYKNLLDSGTITQEEFEVKKKQLLNI